MSSQGPRTPTSAATTAPNWTNHANIEGNSVFATFIVSFGDDTVSGGLQGTNLGFSIPAASVINGIVVSFNRKCSSASLFNAATWGVTMLKAGVTAGNTKSSVSGNYTTSSVAETYGTSSDLWGTTWTTAQINASNFGFQVRAEGDYSLGGSGTRTMSINNYTVTVYYTSALSKSVCSQVVGW